MDPLEIIARLKADAAEGKALDFVAVREQIHDAFENSTDANDRDVLLKVFHSVMDLVERSGNIAEEDMNAFRDTRSKNYRLLLMREVLIGENVSAELLDAVTQREVSADRMSDDDELRQLAIASLREPYLSVQELSKIEKDRLAAESGPKGWRRWFMKK